MARTAPVEGRGDWLGSPPAGELPRALTPALSADPRERAVQHWLRAGQLEHASVAAFARFSLQLLRLGAPAALLQAASAAQADEIRHAALLQRCLPSSAGVQPSRARHASSPAQT